MTLATAGADGRPSARMVLLKSCDERGFGFHTNLESRKAGELAANPRAALVFYWPELGRQVRVEGDVEQISVEDSERYFRTRPHGSQLAAWASPQSRPLASREELERRFRETTTAYAEGAVPLPPHWGGFRIRAEAIEFWEHGEHRLHDRIRFTRAREGWERVRLAP
jgi:pyridoxamine 5'-phosphate oxidase